MSKLSIVVVLVMALTFIACETDIDVSANPTDITVVYGLLDPDDTTHYIKINKAFIGEGSALDLASDADNYNYTVNELDVMITGNDKEYVLERIVNEIPKEEGIFDNSTNVLYKFEEPSIDKNKIYSLKIVNKGLNKEVTSKTSIVARIGIEAPRNNGFFKVWNGDVSSGKYLSQPVIVNVGDNVGRVQTYVIFNYIEHYNGGANPVAKNVRIYLGEKIKGSSSSNSLNFLLKGESFVSNIKAKVSNPTTISNFSHRELDNVSIELAIAGTELSTFMETKAPSTTVNQNKPSYTNIINGIGVFSSRSKFYWVSTKLISNGNLNLNPDTRRYLSTIGLGFCFGPPGGASYSCPM